MPRGSILCVTGHSADPMGQQSYESSIVAALRPVLERSGLSMETATFGPMKSPADLRLPMRLVEPMPARLAAAFAHWQRPGRLVHRMDLRIPPTLVGPEVVTAHDLPPMRFGDEGRLPRWSLASAAMDACVITPSEFAADEIRTFTRPRRVEVIPYGVAPAFQGFGEAETAVAESLGVEPGRYVVHAAGVTERKNLPSLAAAWEAVARRDPKLRLVLCGSPSPRRTSLFEGIPGVVLPGKLRPEEVAGLMSAAMCVVVPSIYEGFGLPALEGMAVGAPVVAARRGALPEVCGDAAVLVDPTPDAMATALLDLAGDEAERERLGAAGRRRAADFRWEDAAEAHVRVYREVLAGR